MLDKIERVQKQLEYLKAVNDERIENYNKKTIELNNLMEKREELRDKYRLLKFILKSSAEYYKYAREGNLKNLGERVGQFMGQVLGKDKYQVDLGIRRQGNYDYLDVWINGLTPKALSGGEKQVFSLAMVCECTSNGVIVLDETINSLDPYALEKALEYLENVAQEKQIFLIELDDNLDVPYDYIAKDNTIVRGNIV